MGSNERLFAAARVGLFVGVIAALLGSTRVEAASCLDTEIVYLVDPMVLVVSGPGNADEERARLEELDFAYLEGSRRITMGQTTFDFEVNP